MSISLRNITWYRSFRVELTLIGVSVDLRVVSLESYIAVIIADIASYRYSKTPRWFFTLLLKRL